MRQKKHKKVQRTITFLKVTHQFREPFKVVLDGNFINALLQSKTDALEAISKLLSAPVKLYTSRCVLRELHALGPDLKAAIKASRSLMVLHCGHEEHPETPGTCLATVLGDDNPQHMFIATQDRALRSDLGRIPGAALIFASVNGLHLEAPSAEQMADARAAVAGHMAVKPLERQSEALAGPLAEAHARKERTIFKRHKAKGPNPLSVRKPKKETKPMQGGGPAADQHRKRARRRKGGTAAGANHQEA
mmetsp:Transcript_16741/g.50023  ORF Transcript_16741/g.50023 Transcript_16741/m.50023 type:complete len:248 (+) Transcript_16741:225-968(+)|eukprot:CAMPEP_0206139200 /NCGR_PEP_ID=MMETSP1473-20131121/4902_1 /ASSEMBLY_ACC=CAM_ASM_001109 /TAXON_ID=1461547 /ORGANISM="Stichococcus sp, Strain RCC1054" /LENGTH=247 /DNA_ID=CAMNT_0053532865 /DNA_START=155 /DNA_END=898 /DNA_ORIENTATION=+